MALELLDTAWALDLTLAAEDDEDLSVRIARFFDATLNNHLFDCTPYHYHSVRTAAFEGLTRDERLALAERRHRWLYTHLRARLAGTGELAAAGPEYADGWLGDADAGVVGIGVPAGEHSRWFAYARPRDAAVLHHEGYPAPELFRDLDPAALRCGERANVVIVYPHGNTTVPVALEQGAALARREGTNLMLCPWPEIAPCPEGGDGLKLLEVRDAMIYVGADDLRACLLASGVPADEATVRAGAVGEGGALIAAAFATPVTAHAIFFHFTHPLRAEIGDVRAPLIQPLIWEAATHLKCRLPDMLRGSGTRTAPQANWRLSDSAGRSEAEAKAGIEAILRDMARRHDRLIVKAEKESGGRSSRLLPVRDAEGVIEESVAVLRDLVYDIAKTDNAVIQEVLRSEVRRLYSPGFLEDMVARFARIGVPVLLDREPATPLYSYFRQVLCLGRDGYEVTHHITVVSTRGIANVGQGGLLYEYTDDIIAPRYRRDMREAITEAAFGSMEAQRAYLREHWREVLDEYLEVRREFADRVPREVGDDLTGFADDDIPYEMGDYMPVFLCDQADNLTHVFDAETEELRPLCDAEGMPTDVPVLTASGSPVPRLAADGTPLAIPLFDEYGLPIPRFDRHGRRIRSLVCYKIEPNPGAGLWRPHDDQLPPERKGEGVYAIFRCLGERAQAYREELAQRVGTPTVAPASVSARYIAAPSAAEEPGAAAE
jgi:hypothetical protein